MDPYTAIAILMMQVPAPVTGAAPPLAAMPMMAPANLMAILESVTYSITYTQEGPTALRELTGRKIAGIGIVSISICSRSPIATAIPAQMVRQWGAQAGISWESVVAQDALLSQAARTAPAQLFLDFGSDAPAIATGLIASKLISANSTWGAAAAGMTLAVTILKARITAHLPDTAAVRAALLPATIAVPAAANNMSGCASEYLSLARYSGTWAKPVALECSSQGCK